MGRSIAEAFESELTEQPTRRLQAFHLPAEALPEAADQPVGNDDATVNIAPAQTQQLLASVFAFGAMHGRNIDDEPTLDAPAPVTPRVPAAPAASAAAVAPTITPSRPMRAPALRALVLTPPPITARSPQSAPRIAVAAAAVITAAGGPDPAAIPVRFATPVPPAPMSGWRRKLPSSLVAAARVARDHEDRRRAAKTFAIAARRSPQLYVVAGIWAMALSLLALLIFMAGV